MTHVERTGKRDLALSGRHRDWGFDVPAVDIDWFIEYDHAQARGLVEYKHEQAAPADQKDPNHLALADLAGVDRAAVPFFGARYAGDFSWFRVVALNKEARVWLPERREMTEDEWVALLYRIRGREVAAGRW